MTSNGEAMTCRSETLLLLLYDELPQEERAACEAHLAGCTACREEHRSLGETLAVVDRAHLRDMATYDAPGDWSRIEPMLLPHTDARRAWRPALARAAGIVLIAGAAFVAGRQWDTIRGLMPGDPPGTAMAPIAEPAPDVDPADRLRVFAERSNGYLQRSRLVLLEFANADAAPDSPALIAASRSLLRENRDARRIAGQIHDARIESLLIDLEETLSGITRLDAGASAEVLDGLRVRVDGLIDRLELLSTSPPRMAQERARA